MSLLYLLLPQCLCSPEFCLQTRVRSTSRASTSGKSCRPMQWVKNGTFPQWSSLEIRLNVHASALWHLTGSSFVNTARVELSSWKQSFHEESSRIVVLPPSSRLSHLVFKISPYYSGVGGWKRQRRKEKGERFIYILVARCLWPLIPL